MRNLKATIRRTIILLAIWAGFIAFLLMTDPNKLSIGWLLIPFAWLFAAIFVTVRFVSRFLSPNGSSRSRRSFVLALVAASVPTLLLLLDSINQLTPKDVLLIIGLGIGGFFYVRRLNLARSNL